MSAKGTVKTPTGTHSVDPYKAQNLEDPPLPQKIEELVDFISEVKFGMLTTHQSEGEYLASRCMSLAGKVGNLYPQRASSNPEVQLTNANTLFVQENGGVDLLFHTNLFSGKTMDLTTHPKEVNMSFLDITTGAWASISGTATVIGDPAVVQKYYSPTLKAWLGDMGDGVHDGGPTDPRIGVIKLESKLATHVVARKGMLGRAVGTVKGAITGDVPSVNSIRELSSEELAECEFHFF